MENGEEEESEVDLKQCRNRIERKTRVEEQRRKKKHANAQRSEVQLEKRLNRVYTGWP